MSREQNKGSKGRLESIGSLIFLVMVLAVSINQAQTGNNALIVSSIESTQDSVKPGVMLQTQAKQEIDEYLKNRGKKSTVEILEFPGRQEGSEVASVIDRVMKYLASTYDQALAVVRK